MSANPFFSLVWPIEDGSYCWPHIIKKRNRIVWTLTPWLINGFLIVCRRFAGSRSDGIMCPIWRWQGTPSRSSLPRTKRKKKKTNGQQHKKGKVGRLLFLFLCHLKMTVEEKHLWTVKTWSLMRPSFAWLRLTIRL